MPLDLRIGVLIIGSLDWESKDYGGPWASGVSEHRRNWRTERIRDEPDHTFMVRVPIRYGRRSTSRANTYTMVVSPAYNKKLGIGKVIRCQRNVTSFNDLREEARWLWSAEDNKAVNERIARSWGCVLPIVPADFLDHEDADARAALLEQWKQFAKDQEHFGEQRFSQADKAVVPEGAPIRDGRLQIDWPSEASGYPLPLDLLLMTATDTGIGTDDGPSDYPTVEQIADAWNTNGHVYYFRCNRQVGIQTADDIEIEKLLK